VTYEAVLIACLQRNYTQRFWQNSDITGFNIPNIPMTLLPQNYNSCCSVINTVWRRSFFQGLFSLFSILALHKTGGV